MFQLPYGSKCSSLSMICRIQTRKQWRSWLHGVLCGGHATGLLHLGMCLPLPPVPQVSCHTVNPLGDFTVLAALFLHIYKDVVWPLLMSAGYIYCLTAADHLTHWPEVVPITYITANTVAPLQSHPFPCSLQHLSNNLHEG
jgi:hypothetical protein